jgi:hypothetical protein
MPEKQPCYEGLEFLREITKSEESMAFRMEVMGGA